MIENADGEKETQDYSNPAPKFSRDRRSKRLVFALKLQVEVNINVKPTGVQNWMPSENGSWLSQHFELLPHINDPSAR